MLYKLTSPSLKAAAAGDAANLFDKDGDATSYQRERPSLVP
jgi:hypothetical protein